MSSKKSVSKSSYFKIIIFVLIFLSIAWIALFLPKLNSNSNIDSAKDNIISGSFDKGKFKSEGEWKKILSPEEYKILRKKGTDLPFIKEMTNNFQKGTYVSVGCNQPVFRSEQKYDSGTGWPSFTAPIEEETLVLKEDYELGYKRIEIMDKCGGHLGHVFDDGPNPTGKRYCINSTALKFIPD